MFKDEVRKNLEMLTKGPVANEEDLYATYDDTFERNTRYSDLGRKYAIKIYRMLLCCEKSLSLYAIKPALALDDSNTDIESLSPAYILRLTRDFTYLTPDNELKFAHVSAIDYLRNHRPDHEEYSDAICHAEMALMCIKCMTSPKYPVDLHLPVSSTFPWYASRFGIKHCVLLDREDRVSRGVSKTLLSWLVKDAGSTAVSHGFGIISGIKNAMLTASICNFVEIGSEVIQSRLSAHESLSDLFTIGKSDKLPRGLDYYTARNITPYKKRQTPLMWAALCGSEDMVELLLKYDKEPDAHEKFGRTALSFAAEEGHEAIVEKFLLLGESINRDSPDSHGRTPLFYAARQGHLRTVQLLLESRADPNVPTRMGETPLFPAVHNGHLAIVRLLLLEKEVDCDHQNEFGATPLLYASEGSNPKMVQLLLESGADLESKDDSDRTPLSHAAEDSNLKMVQLLLESGADLETRDESNRTPLSYAAERGNLEIVQLLLEHKADPESKDESDRIPLSYAAERGYLEILRLLESNGRNGTHNEGASSNV